MKITIKNIADFERLKSDLPAATVVRVYNCPGLTALPDLPAATYVRVWDCPGLTERR